MHGDALSCVGGSRHVQHQGRSVDRRGGRNAGQVKLQYRPANACRHLVGSADVEVHSGAVAEIAGGALVQRVVGHRHEGHDRSRWRGRRQRRVLDLPVRLRHGPQVTLRGLDRRAVHRVQIVLARSRVAPEHVRLAVVIPGALDLPRGIRHGAQIAFGAEDGRAVHRVEVVLPGRAVPPQDVALPVAVEVAHAGDLPVLVGDCADKAFARLDGGAVHEIDVVLAGADIPPQDVGFAVAIEVADSGDLPALVGHLAEVALARLDGQSVHQVDVVVPGGAVPPQDVGLAVAVEIADPGDLPALVGHRADVALRADRGPGHDVDVVFAGGRIAPQDVRVAIAVEVPDARHLPALVGHRAHVALGRLDRRAVHRIQVVLARERVAPEDVRVRVAVEVRPDRRRGHGRVNDVDRARHAEVRAALVVKSVRRVQRNAERDVAALHAVVGDARVERAGRAAGHRLNAEGMA